MKVSIEIVVDVPGDLEDFLRQCNKTQLARQVGCSRQNITRVAADNSITLPLLKRIEKAIGAELGSAVAIEKMNEKLEEDWSRTPFFRTGLE